MVKNGLRDWLTQRVTSVILAAYVLFLAGFFLTHSSVDFFGWQDLFANNWMRVFSVLALLSLALHAWVGLWTVTTDYVKPVAVRLAVQVVIILALAAYFFWGVEILWGIA
jgi:succinate dehydrogenase / fumarate reductase membrane anchor subunit